MKRSAVLCNIWAWRGYKSSGIKVQKASDSRQQRCRGRIGIKTRPIKWAVETQSASDLTHVRSFDLHTKVNQFLLFPLLMLWLNRNPRSDTLTWCLLLLRTSWCSLIQTSQLIFWFYYSFWRAPTSLHCWLPGVHCSILQYTKREKKCASFNSLFLFAYLFLGGEMTEFWHFSCLFNVRNDPTEFENNRTNTSSVILIWLHSLPFSVNQSKVVQLNVCLSTKCRFKKKYMVINWGVSLFNVWVTVRSTVQNSLSASYLQENCQWQKQNYDFFFFLYFFMDFKTTKSHNWQTPFLSSISTKQSTAHCQRF